MAVQEDHDFARGLLFGPRGENAGRTNRPDAFDLAQSIRSGLDDVDYRQAYGAIKEDGPGHGSRPCTLALTTDTAVNGCELLQPEIDE